VQYYSSARLDDALEVSAIPVKLGRASIVFEQQVKREDKVLCKAEVKIACVDRQTGSPQAMPESMYTHVHSVMG